MRKLLAPAVPIRQASNGSTEGQSPSKYMYMYSTCENLGPCVRRFPFLTNSSHSGSDTSHGESLAQLRSAWGATVKVVYHRQKLRSCLDRQEARSGLFRGSIIRRNDQENFLYRSRRYYRDFCATQISREISGIVFLYNLADFPSNFRKPTPEPSDACGCSPVYAL